MKLSPGARLPLALSAALVASLCGNVLLARGAFDFFRETGQVRLDPIGLDVYAADRAKPPVGGPLLMFFGDSRSAMWTEPSTPTGYRILNHGIGRQTTTQILMRVDRDVVPFHPTVVVLEAGINDLKTIVEFRAQRARIIADCEANLARIVEQCREAGATVVIVTVFDIGDIPLWRRPFWSSDVAAAVREVNAYLPKLVGDRVVLFDVTQVLDDSHGTIQEEYQFDYLHLSGAGYAALNKKLLPLLSELPK